MSAALFNASIVCYKRHPDLSVLNVSCIDLHIGVVAGNFDADSFQTINFVEFDFIVRKISAPLCSN